MKQQQIDKQLDAIINNKRVYKKLYSKESTVLKKLGAEVRRENIKKAYKKLRNDY
jgi:hypothetical protein